MLGPSKAQPATITTDTQDNIHNTPPKLTNVQYIIINDASLGYHNLKCGRKSSYLATFECQFGMSRLTRLPFGKVPAGDMFHRKIDEIFEALQMYLA